MIKLKVEVDDWDIGETTQLTLPCEVKNSVDVSHELQIIDWDGNFCIGFDDVVELNEAIEDINSENPCMTLELLEVILEASNSSSLNDKRFLEKICNSDFMLEELVGTEKWLMSSEEEKCACYLATEMLIPFAKNITTDYLESISENLVDVIDWNTVWRYYFQMGFKVISLGDTIYAFHWGNAEQ